VAERRLDDEELLARQAALQDEARAFLERHAVERVLEPCGRVVPVGSYVTGLMVWRDLDVCVDASGLGREAAWEGMRPLVLAADRVRYEHLEEPDDRRHYFVLRIDGWKLDVSMFTCGIPPDVDEFQDRLRAALDDDTRLTILRLKDAWYARPEYPETVGAFEIYEAVLAGARTEEELTERLGRM
jgi:hypothetical protein